MFTVWNSTKCASSSIKNRDTLFFGDIFIKINVNPFNPMSSFTRTWLLSACRLSSVTLVHPTQGVETIGNISSPLCTLAILWPPCKILRRSFQGNPSVGAVKRKRCSKIERRWTYRRLYLVPMSRSGLSLVFWWVSCKTSGEYTHCTKWCHELTPVDMLHFYLVLTSCSQHECTTQMDAMHYAAIDQNKIKQAYLSHMLI